jgi:hypothetical protein
VSSQVVTNAATQVCSGAPAAGACGALSARPAARTTTYRTAPTGVRRSWAANLGQHSQKHFAMTGIGTNVWPLSPKDWLSG